MPPRSTCSSTTPTPTVVRVRDRLRPGRPGRSRHRRDRPGPPGSHVRARPRLLQLRPRLRSRHLHLHAERRLAGDGHDQTSPAPIDAADPDRDQPRLALDRQYSQGQGHQPGLRDRLPDQALRQRPDLLGPGRRRVQRRDLPGQGRRGRPASGRHQPDPRHPDQSRRHPLGLLGADLLHAAGRPRADPDRDQPRLALDRQHSEGQGHQPGRRDRLPDQALRQRPDLLGPGRRRVQRRDLPGQGRRGRPARGRHQPDPRHPDRSRRHPLGLLGADLLHAAGLRSPPASTRSDSPLLRADERRKVALFAQYGSKLAARGEE